MSNSTAHTLTKEQLKLNLRQHNIPLPSSDSKKDVYVRLYIEKVLSPQGEGDVITNGKKPANRPSTAGFSSDEEDVVVTTSTSSGSTRTLIKEQHQNRSPYRRGRHDICSPCVVALEQIDKDQWRSQCRRRGHDICSPCVVALEQIDKTSFISTSSRKMYTEEDLAALSNHQLFNALKDLGAEVGPVVATTRRVYEKKLLQLQLHPSGTTATPRPLNDVSDNSDEDMEVEEDEEDEGEEEEEEEEEDAAPEAPITPPRPAVSSLTARLDNFNTNNRNISRSQGDSSQVSHLHSRKTFTATYARKSIHDFDVTGSTPSCSKSVSQTGSSAAKTSKRLIPIWMQIAIFLFVAVLIFLIVQNMEPAFKNPFKNALPSE